MDSVDAPSAQARDLIGRRPPLLEGGNDSSPGSVSSVVIEVECPSRIRLVERDGILITIDNRRLEAFRRAKTDIPTVMATSEEIDIAIQQEKLFLFQEAGVPIRTIPATAAEIADEAWKFTTRDAGVTIRIRGGL